MKWESYYSTIIRIRTRAIDCVTVVFWCLNNIRMLILFNVKGNGLRPVIVHHDFVSLSHSPYRLRDKGTGIVTTKNDVS